MEDQMVMCDECGEQEAVVGQHCEDCACLLAEEVCYEDTPSLCNCEDRPCCGCDYKLY